MAPTRRGNRSKSFKICPGFAVSGQTPRAKFFPNFNLLSSPSIIFKKSFSTKPGSTVLSIIINFPSDISS